MRSKLLFLLCSLFASVSTAAVTILDTPVRSVLGSAGYSNAEAFYPASGNPSGFVSNMSPSGAASGYVSNGVLYVDVPDLSASIAAVQAVDASLGSRLYSDEASLMRLEWLTIIDQAIAPLGYPAWADALNDLSGVNTAASSGYTYNQAGKWISNVTQPDPYALVFDGVDEYVDLPNAPSYTQTNNYTIVAWLRPSGVASEEWPFSVCGNNHFGIRFDAATTKVGADHYDGSVTWECKTFYPTGVWSHIAVTKSSTNLQVYLNGTLSNTTAHTISTIYNPSSSDAIGEYLPWTAGGFAYHGQVDEAALWSRVLTAAEIGDLAVGLYVNPGSAFPSTSTPVTNSLVYLWHLDDGSGTTATNSFGGLGNGTLANMEAGDWVTGTVQTPATTNTMTLVLNPFSLDAPGTVGRLMIGVTNLFGDTNVTGYLSSDGGSTWSNVTVTDYAAMGYGYRVMDGTNALNEGTTNYTAKIVVGDSCHLRVRAVGIVVW